MKEYNLHLKAENDELHAFNSDVRDQALRDQYRIMELEAALADHETALVETEAELDEARTSLNVSDGRVDELISRLEKVSL